MGLDGFRAQAQPLADLACSQSPAEQLKDFKLPVDQLAKDSIVRAQAAAGEDVQDIVGHVVADVNFAPQDLADGIDQLLASFAFMI